ncbi:MAG TPA: hypothetical protein VJ377_04730, partial [Dehalococcoidales bacterium]|nr:hypothetical protein [Dehalococcoidales bacterium]
SSAMSASFFSGPRHRCTTRVSSASRRIAPWAPRWSCQKSGREDRSSSRVISFSLPTTSKMLQGQGDSGP